MSSCSFLAGWTTLPCFQQFYSLQFQNFWGEPPCPAFNNLQFQKFCEEFLKSEQLCEPPSCPAYSFKTTLNHLALLQFQKIEGNHFEVNHIPLLWIILQFQKKIGNFFPLFVLFFIFYNFVGIQPPRVFGGIKLGKQKEINCWNFWISNEVVYQKKQHLLIGGRLFCMDGKQDKKTLCQQMLWIVICHKFQKSS